MSWQGWLPDMQSPKGLFVAMGAMASFLVPLFVVAESLENPRPPELRDLTIQDSTRHHYRDGRHYIAVVGTLRNESSATGSRPHFEVRFFNANGELIDTFASDAYDLVVPGKQEVAFRVRAPAQHDESAYHRHEIRLTAILGWHR